MLENLFKDSFQLIKFDKSWKHFNKLCKSCLKVAMKLPKSIVCRETANNIPIMTIQTALQVTIWIQATDSFQYVPDSTDSFRTSKKVCKQIENGVTAIFGKHWMVWFYDEGNNSIRKVQLSFFRFHPILLKRTPFGCIALAPHPIHLRSFRYTSFG